MEEKKDQEQPKATPYPIKSFLDTGLLRFVNMFLHIFGFAFAYNVDDNGNIEEEKGFRVLRVQFRGFSEKSMSDSYIKVSKFMDIWHKELLEEAKK